MAEKLHAVADSTEARRTRILQGALEVFLAYGYTRTTMDDIARAAEVSRPALYLVFKNKTDIYRAIGSCLLAKSVAAARDALAGEGVFSERMATALDEALFQTMARIHESPHGEEIVDMKNSLAADLIERWRGDLADVMEEAIAAEAQRRSTDLEARGLTACGLADVVLDGLEGMKARGASRNDMARGIERLVALVEIALRPG